MQETQKYGDTVRQHVDLETIQRRLGDGAYASSAVSLHRDLLLLFTNAVVFFPPNSLHSAAAHQLRALLLRHIRQQDHQPTSCPPSQPKPELERSDSLLARQKAAAHLIVCRKRTRPSSTASAPDPDRTPTPAVTEPAADNKPEKPVTGVRSSRRNNSRKGNTGSVVGSGAASTPGPPSTEEETPTKTEKKKRESTTAQAGKKRSATDFLKRIKKNSPGKKGEQKKGGNNNNGKEAAGKGSNKKQEGAKSGGRVARKGAGEQQTSAAPGGRRGKGGMRQAGKRARK